MEDLIQHVNFVMINEKVCGMSKRHHSSNIGSQNKINF